MNDEPLPSIITAEDIKALQIRFEEDLKKPAPTSFCPSCGEEWLTIMLDYYTGQCDECFFARRPWMKASPVSDAYWKL